MIVRLVQVYYAIEHGELIVHLRGRREDGKPYRARLLGTRPYFYAKKVPTHDFVTSVLEKAGETLEGESVHRIYVRYPFQVPEVRKGLEETWEADILYPNRVKIDLGIKACVEVPDDRTDLWPADVRPADGAVPHRVIYFDIECSDRGPLSIREPKSPVVSVTLHDTFTDRYVVLLNGALNNEERNRLAAEFVKREWNVTVKELSDEAEVFGALRDFLHAVGPSIFCGWNGVLFDAEFLKNRHKELSKGGDVPCPDWGEHVWYDAMAAYSRKKEGEAEGLGLDFVARSLGLGHKEKRGKVWEMYEKDRAALLLYNAVDVHLLKQIVDKLDLVGFFVNLAEFCGIGIDLIWNENDGFLEMSESRLIDSYILHYLRGSKILPTKRRIEAAKFRGAHVFDPVPGVYANVIEADHTGQYSNTIRTLNLSPETRIKDPSWAGPCYTLPSGNRYKKEPRGILPIILDDLIRLRYEMKAKGDRERERVVKELSLSVFGTIKDKLRISDPAIAADITWVSRDQLVWTRNQIEKVGGIPLYSDTDGALAILPGALTYEEADAKAKVLVKEINASFADFLRPFGVDDKYYIEIKLERVYDAVMLSSVKKRYAALYRDPNGVILHDEVRYSMKVRGFELRRSNAAPITKRLQEEIFRRVLFGDAPNDITQYVRSVVNDARTGKVPIEDFYVPVGLRQTDYKKSVPEHVRAARWSNKNLGKKFTAGDKLRLLFVRGVDGCEPTDVVALEWDDKPPPNALPNWDKIIERTIVSPLANVFEVIGVSANEVLHPMMNLDDVL